MPVLLIERPLNVAMPPEAATVVVPLSVPPPAFVPIAIVTEAVLLVTRFPLESSTCTVIAGVIEAPATVLLGCWLNANFAAAPYTIKFIEFDAPPPGVGFVTTTGYEPAVA